MDDVRLQAALYRDPQNATIVASASRRLFRVGMAADAFINGLKDRAARLGALAGSNATGSSTAGSNAAGFNEIVETLHRDGCLDAESKDADWLRFSSKCIDLEALQHTSLVLVENGRVASLIFKHELCKGFNVTLQCELSSLDRVIRERDSRALVVIAVSDHFDYDFLTTIDDLSSESGFRWIPFHIDGGRGWLGPAIVPDETPRYRDVLARRLCAAGSVPLFHALTNPPVYGQPYVPPETELLWMLSILSVEVQRWVVGVAPASAWSELELDPVNFAVILHPVLPLPEREGLQSPRRFDMEVFVDERTGIVNRLERVRTHRSVPSMLHIVQSVACEMRRISYWSNGRLNHGSSFVADEAAKNAAIAECIERYCGNWVDSKKLAEASYDELTARGDHAVDPEQLVLHSAAQYEAAGFPLVPFTRDLRVYWVRGQCLTCDRSAWVPASLVHVNWYLGPYANDPPTSYAIFSGIAAGSSWDAAVAAGLEEIIERDATMIWWLNAHRLPGVKLTADLEAVWAGPPTALGQRAWLMYLENEFDVPVMAGVVENVQDELLTIGFAVRPDPAEAGLKAWAEALGLQETARLMRDPASSFWGITANLINDQSLKAPREDRQYLDVYRNDFHDVNTLLSQLQVNLDPRAREIVRGWVDVDTVRPLSSLPRLSDRSSATYRERLQQRGFEIFAVDMTTPDVAMTDIKVARVVVPGLVPNYPAAFPPFGHRRIQDVAVALGWRDRPLEERELNTFPMPHA